MGPLKIRSLKIISFFLIGIIVSCSHKIFRSKPELVEVKFLMKKNTCAIVLFAKDEIYYERFGGNNYFIIYQGGVCYQSNLPELYKDSIVFSSPKDVNTNDLVLDRKYLSKGDQDTLYDIDFCSLETYDKLELTEGFNLQLEQIVYPARTQDKRHGKKNWITEESQLIYLKTPCK